MLIWVIARYCSATIQRFLVKQVFKTYRRRRQWLPAINLEIVAAWGMIVVFLYYFYRICTDVPNLHKNVSLEFHAYWLAMLWRLLWSLSDWRLIIHDQGDSREGKRQHHRRVVPCSPESETTCRATDREAEAWLIDSFTFTSPVNN